MTGNQNIEAVVDQLRRAVEDATAGQGGELGSVEQAKVFDVSSAVQAEKEKMQARNAEAITRRMQKELQECTFQPSISKKSLDLLAQSKRERIAVHER